MRRLFEAVVLALILAGVIAVAAKWAVDLSFPKTKTIKTQQFAPKFGNLTLSATPFSENEVMLNLTFSGTAYVSYPGYNWTIWVSKSIAGYLYETPLTEGLELVEGTLKANAICPLPNNFLSLQAKLRAIADGEWTVYGLFSATYGPGLYYGLSTGGIRISVSNGSIVRVEEAPYPTDSQMTAQQLGNQTEQLTNPPIRPTNP